MQSTLSTPTRQPRVAGNAAPAKRAAATSTNKTAKPKPVIAQSTLDRLMWVRKAKTLLAAEEAALRSTILKKLDAGAAVEKGALRLSTKVKQSIRLSQPVARQILGQQRFDELMAQVKPTQVIYLFVEPAPLVVDELVEQLVGLPSPKPAPQPVSYPAADAESEPMELPPPKRGVRPPVHR